MVCNWYLDLTENHEHSGDKESLLVWLCDDCAAPLERLGEIRAENGGDDPEYDLCWKCNNP